MRIRNVVVGTILLGLTAVSLGAVLWYFKGRELVAFRRAEQAFTNQDWSEAKAQYGWYLAQQPDDVDALVRYAETSAKVLSNRTINVRDAARAYRRVAVLRPEDEAAAIRAATFCEDHELWLDLQSCGQQFSEKFPGNADFTFWRALAEEKLGNVDLALTQYEALLQSPSYPLKAMSALVALLTQRGRMEDAQARLDAAIESKPDSAVLRAYRGDHFIQRNQLVDAEKQIDEALRLGRELPEVLLAAGRLHIARRDWNKAKEFAESYLKSRPDLEAYLLYCQATIGRGAEGDAQAASLLKTADPKFLADHPQLYFILSEIQFGLNQLDDARATADAYRLAHPDHVAALEYFDARLLHAAGQVDEAIVKLRRVVQGAPDLRVAAQRLVAICLETRRARDRELARETLERYMRANPSDAQAIALWRMTFAQPTLEVTIETAKSIHSDDGVPAATMIDIASKLLRDGKENAHKTETVALAQALLEKAYQGDPAVPDLLLARVECYLAGGNTSQAEEALANVPENGNAESELRLAQARLALAQADMDRAQEFVMQEMQRTNATETDRIRWAQLFADNGQLDIGLTILRDGIGRENSPASAAESAIEQVALAIRTRSYSRALELIASLAPQFSENPETIQRLVIQQLAVAEALASSEDDRDRKEAESIVLDVCQRHPDNTLAKALHARLKFATDPPDVEGAEELCAQLRTSGAADSRVYMLSAEIAARSGQDALAYSFASKAAELAPYDSHALFLSGKAQLQQGRYGEAAASLAKALRIDPATIDILRPLARAYAGAGRFAEFDATLSKIESEQPLSALQETELRLLRSWAAICRRDWTNAEQISRSVVERDNANTEALRYLVIALASTGKIADAEILVSESVPASRDAQVWCELAVRHLVSERPPNILKASTAFTKALAIRPNYPLALIGLIEIEQQTGNAGRALGLCNRFIETSPDDVGILLKKAQILAGLPDREAESLQTVNAILTKTTNPDAMYLRGTLLLAKQQYGDALRDFQNSAKLTGNSSAQLQLRMAEAYFGLKETNVARLYVEQAKQQATNGEPVDQRRLAELAAQLNGSPQ
ncbi:MAG: tetratricopeptide repeat protein [Candidatus Hydrogenedentes bacterium]|nr:tetratricopeptide repeat protein [Candidatus Hydrogenedentota bacterium]